MEKIDFLLISSICALLFSLIGTILGLVAVIKVIAMEKSTHTVTYQAIDEEIDKANREFLQKESPWATKESAIAKDQEEFKEDLEVDMPEFFPSDDDRKIHSF